MKKIWKLFLAAIIICGTTTVLSSCGGDDDDGGIGGGSGASGGASFKTAKVTYTISVSPALLTDFKVNAYYIVIRIILLFPRPWDQVVGIKP